MSSPLEQFLGEWTLVPHFENLPAPDDGGGATVSFAWMAGEQFLIERWTIPVPEAPDGIALIGADPERPGGFLQHYFDSRGVARVYRMAVEGRVWTLWRDEPDFSPLDFRQRFTGTFSDDGRTIEGTWDINHGTDWEKDFAITYRRRGSRGAGSMGG